MHSKLPRTLFAVFLFLFFSGLLFHTVWHASVRAAERKAIQLAQALEAGLSEAYIKELNADNSDISKESYAEIKQSFIKFVSLNQRVRFACILVKKNDGIYIAVDSESSHSKDYSPPGDKYYEATPVDYHAFESGQTTITPVFTDRWGSWVSVLVPIRYSNSNIVTSVLSVDYPAERWYDGTYTALFYAGILLFCLFTILFFFRRIELKSNMLRLEQMKAANSEKQLRESEKLFQALFDQATIGLALIHTEEFVAISPEDRRLVNPMFEKIVGRTANELCSITWGDIIHPDDLHEARDLYQKTVSDKDGSFDAELRLRRPDGSDVWVHMIISPLRLENNPNINHLCMMEDVGKRKEMEKVLSDGERSKTVLLDNLPGMAYRCKYDREWTMEFVSQGCFELTGYLSESLIENRDISFNDLIAPAYREWLWNRWEDGLQKREKVTVEYEIITASGEIKWVWEQGQGIFDEQGCVMALEGLVLDITKRKNHEIRLKYLGEHDQLTGLYNRRRFEETIASTNHADGRSRAALLINIRKFSLLNTAYGYTYGDTLIREVASGLVAYISDNRTLFHISIDRFILLVTDYQCDDELRELCESILHTLRSVLESKIIGANISVVRLEEQHTDGDCIIKHASIAAESVSTTQNYEYGFYTADMEQKVSRVNQIKNELVEAIYAQNSEKLFMVYQPIVELSTNAICGFEALARYQSEQLGLVSPLEFIPIAEETQLIIPLGRLVMRQVFRALCNFAQQYKGPLTVTFNISAIQLLREDFISDLDEAIRAAGADPHMIGIELTESVFSDNFAEINIKLDQIRQRGIRISIDDFGTGYSSLAREKELNVDCLKIDKYFVDKLMEGETEHALTGDIISMGHKLGHCVIAEGVEHESQRQYLIENQCDKMQGFLFSKPVSEEEALQLLLNYPDLHRNC